MLGLLLATVLWGCGFTWAKAAGEGVHQAAGLPAQSMFGPIFVLAWRFGIAGVALLMLVPAARKGWSGAGACSIALVGLLLAIGLVVQHLGLDRTSEAVSAFLTSLTILFVPLLVMIIYGKLPAPILWMGVAVAMAGIWMMTGATPTGFGVGELLGLACAAAFAAYILAVNAVAKRENVWRLTAGQFLVVSAICALTCLFVQGGPQNLLPAQQLKIILHPQVWLNLLLLSLFPTLGAFSLLNYYQPRLDPTRAALIYLVEPVVASVYAFIAVGRGFDDAKALLGAGLILAANALVEVLSASKPASAAVADARSG